MVRMELIGEEGTYYEMANLFPEHMGLPFPVWVSIRGRVRHAAHLIEGGGTMSPYQLSLLTEWIDLNREVILQCWNEEIDTVDRAAAIRPVRVK